MGRLLDKYMAEYEAAIAPGIKAGKPYVAKPEIWIYFKWERDNNVKPWDKVRHQNALTNAMMQDPELGGVLVAGLKQALEMVDDATEKK